MTTARQLLLLAVLCPALGGCAEDGNAGAGDPSLVQPVGRGSLSITVRERGEIQAAKDTRVVSQLEGRATLIYLIPEGTVVKAGDKLAELDASLIAEKRANQAIAVAKARAALEQARKNFEIMEKELGAADKTAQNRLQIAKLRREKFLGQGARIAGGSPEGTNAAMVGKLEELLKTEQQNDPLAQARYGDLAGKVVELIGSDDNLGLDMGEMANQVLQQIDEISLARADLQVAEDTLNHSKKLAAKDFITRNELERHLIDHKRQLSRVSVAWNNLQLLIKYTLHETLITLEQEVENADLGLASVRGTNEARRVREAAELESSEAESQLAQERLDNWNQQIENAVMRAPAPGLVVYGRFDWDEPVYEGMEVRERQEVVILPDVSAMVAELKVHEAQINKVAVGQRATVKVDAFLDRSFPGRVCDVSPLPDPSPRSQEFKVYRVKVMLEGNNADRALRPGMNASVEIDVGVLTDVVNVPLPAIRRSGDTHFVWKATAQGPVAVEVELGGNNLTHVEIVAGVSPGDRIHLVDPPGALPPAPKGRGSEATEAPDGSRPPAVEASGQRQPPTNGGDSNSR